MRTTLLVVLTLTPLALLASTDAASTHAVEVFSNGYRDSATRTPLTGIDVGTTVVWTWTAGLHSVTFGTNEFLDPLRGPDSGERDTDLGAEPFSVRFDAAGDFLYFCGRHPTMRGVVHVE